ncbi:hypothetical protein [Rhizobium sp. 2MFCol3.1]|uniref:hypothetical protein n=1 Tax=Rhizobium sp. 2MFCol3.1 TaxID=1246459 RepID=UPI00035C49C1|nr:hypothetical protein [Rhizobium sp. 2MFCol3.1]
MFSNIDEILAALKGLPGQMGGAMPQVGPDGQVPMTPPAPVAPPQAAPAVDPVATGSISPTAGQYASFANPNGPTAPGLTGQFPDAPGMGGMLGPAGRALGTNDGTAGPTAFGGLLKFKDEDSKQAAMRGLLAGSMGLMAAGGPSDKPHSVGQDIAQGGMTGIAGYEGYKDANSDRAFKAAQASRLGADAAKDSLAVEQARKAAAVRERLFGSGVGFNGGSNTGATVPPTSASAAPAAPTSDLAGQINRQRADLDRQYNALMLINEDETARAVFAQKNFLDNQAAQKGLVWNGASYTAAPGYNEGVQQTAFAEGSGRQAGTESQIRTDDQRNFEYGLTHPEFVTPQQKQAATDARAAKQAAFKDEQDLRKEYTSSPVYKRWDEVRASFDRIASSAKQDNGAGDLGIIYGYMKVLDPGSVVREGEFATAEQASGVPTQILNLYNKAVNGERLTPEQRKMFVSAAQDLYAAEAGKLGELNTRYSGIAGTHGFDAGRIVVQPKTYDPIEVATGASTGSSQPKQEWKPRSSRAQSAIPQVGEVRRGYKFNGGDPALPSNWTKAN